jgi:hypothetical protein
MKQPTYLNPAVQEAHTIAKCAFVGVLNHYKNLGLRYTHLFSDYHSLVADAAIEIYKVSLTNHPLSSNQRLLFLCGFNHIREESIIDKFWKERRLWVSINKRHNNNVQLLFQDISQSPLSLFPKGPVDVWYFSSVLSPSAAKEDCDNKLYTPLEKIFRRKIFNKTERIRLLHLIESDPLSLRGTMIFIVFNHRSAAGRLYISSKNIKEMVGEDISVQRTRHKNVKSFINNGSSSLLCSENICFLNDIQLHGAKTMTYSVGIKSAVSRLETKSEIAYNKNIALSGKYCEPSMLHETTANIINSRLEGLRLIKKEDRLAVKKSAS